MDFVSELFCDFLWFCSTQWRLLASVLQMLFEGKGLSSHVGEFSGPFWCSSFFQLYFCLASMCYFQEHVKDWCPSRDQSCVPSILRASGRVQLWKVSCVFYILSPFSFCLSKCLLVVGLSSYNYVHFWATLCVGQSQGSQLHSAPLYDLMCCCHCCCPHICLKHQCCCKGGGS